MTEEDKSKEITDAQTEEVKENPQQDAAKKSLKKSPSHKKNLIKYWRMLAERQRRLKKAQKEYDDLLASIEAKEKAANDAAAEQVEALRKDLPEAIAKLLDKLTPIEQLEWLT
jgi:formate dehydrogenase maturation protein FdhE